jgi:hypothetical protein
VRALALLLLLSACATTRTSESQASSTLALVATSSTAASTSSTTTTQTRTPAVEVTTVTEIDVPPEWLAPAVPGVVVPPASSGSPSRPLAHISIRRVERPLEPASTTRTVEHVEQQATSTARVEVVATSTVRAVERRDIIIGPPWWMWPVVALVVALVLGAALVVRRYLP